VCLRQDPKVDIKPPELLETPDTRYVNRFTVSAEKVLHLPKKKD
jgi:hypothetical protein